MKLLFHQCIQHIQTVEIQVLRKWTVTNEWSFCTMSYFSNYENCRSVCLEENCSYFWQLLGWCYILFKTKYAFWKYTKISPFMLIYLERNSDSTCIESHCICYWISNFRNGFSVQSIPNQLKCTNLYLLSMKYYSDIRFHKVLKV